MQSDREQLGSEIISPAQLRLETRGTPTLPAIIQEDILVQIFSELAKDTQRTHVKSTFARWDWVSVMEVCRYWHAVAIGTPRLWSYLHDFSSLGRIKRQLRLSKDSDLTIDHSEERYAQTKELGNLNTVLEEMQRIRYLHIRFFKSDNASLLLSSLTLPAPRLKSMDLKLGMHSRKAFELPHTSPGVLKRVALEYMDVSPSISCFTSLSSLSLCSCTITLLDLLRVFEISPTLTALSLFLCDIAHSEVLNPIRLHRLSYLRLSCIDFSICSAIVGNLDAPNLDWWKIQSLEALSPEELSRIDIFKKLLHSRYICNVLQISICTIRCNPSGQVALYKKFDLVSSVYEAGEAYLDIPIQLYVDLNAVLLQMIEISRSYLENTEGLFIGVIEESITDETWNVLFKAASSTRTLSFTFGRCSGKQVFKALEHTSTELSPTIKTSCPNLERICICWTGKEPDLGGFLRLLAKLLKTRSARGFSIRKISVLSEHSVPRNEEFNKLEKWVQELEWITLDEQREQRLKKLSDA